jgi:3-oxoacyl-[acyl-carrier protein] reductase
MCSHLRVKKPFTLITGATSSLGAEIARRRASTDSLLLHGRNLDELTALANELAKETEVKIWCRDFIDPTGLHADLLKLLGDEAIQIRRVVHAAGCIKILPFRRFELEETIKIFNVNVLSIIEILRVLTRSAYRPHLHSVVFLSAFFSKFGDKGNAIYSSSKGALNSLIKGLAVEFSHIRFNALLLGAVRTKMTEHLFSNANGNDNNRFSRYLLGTGKPDDVANAVDFLLSDDLWMTGQEISFDGGASVY